jgi:hypothetical protein
MMMVDMAKGTKCAFKSNCSVLTSTHTHTYRLPYGDYFLWVLMFDIFKDWPKNAKFCTRATCIIEH